MSKDCFHHRLRFRANQLYESLYMTRYGRTSKKFYQVMYPTIFSHSLCRMGRNLVPSLDHLLILASIEIVHIMRQRDE